MKVENPQNILFRGRIGNIIYYVRNGVTYARGVSSNKRKESTPKQKESESRFRLTQVFYSYYCKVVSPEIWRKAAELEGRAAINLFNSTNNKYFDGKEMYGRIADYEHFMFSKGAQLLPRNITAERNERQVHVYWEDDREGVTAAASDRLCVGVMYECFPTRIFWIQEVMGVRGDMRGEFTLPDLEQKDIHVYCFFMREDGGAFSESHHIKL